MRIIVCSVAFAISLGLTGCGSRTMESLVAKPRESIAPVSVCPEAEEPRAPTYSETLAKLVAAPMPTIVTFDLRTYGDQDEADPLSMEPTATPIRVSSIRMDLVGRFHTIFQHWSNRSKRDGLSFRDCVTDSQGVQVGTLRDQPARNVSLSIYGSAVLGRSTDGEEFILKWGSLGRMA